MSRPTCCKLNIEIKNKYNNFASNESTCKISLVTRQRLSEKHSIYSRLLYND